jgi:hypothetical protein
LLKQVIVPAAKKQLVTPPRLEISRRVMLIKGFDPEDASFRAAIREHICPSSPGCIS